jgi:hypothetical protein
MFPLFLRRSLGVLVASLVTATVVLVPGSAYATSSLSAASVIKAAQAAIAKQISVHVVVYSRTGKVKTKVVVDIGRKTGTERITQGAKSVTITLTKKGAYVRGTPTGMTGIMGLTAAQEKIVGTLSVAMAVGSAPYKSFQQSLTTPALLTFLPAAKGTTLLPTLKGSHSYRLRWTTKSTTSPTGVTSTIFISSRSDSLPLSETITGATGGGTTTFSRWGETIYAHAPDPSKVITYKKVFG